MKETRLTWGGNLTAQEEADKAWNALRAKAKTKPTQATRTKKQRRQRKPAKPFVGTYHEYIQSRQWGKKRKQAHKHFGGKCTVCGSGDRLDVHHKHYRSLFNERMGDLDLLCNGCHRNHHEADGKCADPMTAEFVALASTF